ncbi:hypothetical protein KSS87_001238 [Heliosperma pusillum]|nr:hypothetical protein KSS87_001238 [Heliosperma pusillum]
MSNRVELGRPSSGKRRLKDLLRQQDNRCCADCGAPDPKWAFTEMEVCDIGEFDHGERSKVLSVTLDEWSDEDIDAMIEVGGNAAANSIYEAYIPEGSAKPGPNAGHDDRTRFIRSKYELQEFLKPSLRIVSMPNAKGSHQPTSSKEGINLFQSSDSSKKPDNTEGMVEFIGMLKVKVVKGTNLAVRDMLSSDPYVLLNLGQQKVFDYDTFSADDIMGEAEIDIQSLITSAMAYGDPGMFGNMQIGKWLKSNDNALIEDSTINIVDGAVKQQMELKLQDVESGEIELELEWMPLDQ